MSAAVLGYGERPDTGYGSSFALAFAIHAVLIAILFLGVRMQSSAPDAASASLSPSFVNRPAWKGWSCPSEWWVS